MTETLFPSGLGKFTIVSREDHPTGRDQREIAGHMVLIDRRLRLTLLAEQDDLAELFSQEYRFNPACILGAMTDYGVLLLEVVDSGGNNQLGNSRASVRNYEIRTAVSGVPIHRVKSHLVRSMEMHLPGQGQWVQMSAADLKPTRDADGRLQSLVITLSSEPDRTVAMSGGRTLAVSTEWSVSGPEHQRQIRSPIAFRCFADSPVEVWTLLEPLLRLQDLVNVAWDGFVPALGGSLEPDMESVRDPFDRVTFDMWSGPLFMPADGAQLVTDFNPRPLFFLDWIGGQAGLAGWLRLCEEHPRAVQPIIERHRYGKPATFPWLLNIAAALEYWAAVHKGEPWIDLSQINKSLAAHAGPEFDTWTGGAAIWAGAFSDVNRTMKHRPHEPLPSLPEISHLAEAGWYLLLSTLLCDISNTNLPAEGIFTGSRTYNLGAEIRRTLTRLKSAHDARSGLA